MDVLTGKVALVTGASRGIGRAIAEALGQAGLDVAVNYRESEAKARDVCARVEANGRRALAVQADVGLSADVSRMIQTVEAQLGPIDVLVNNAGIMRIQAPLDISELDWDEIIDQNLKSVFLVTQAVLPGMRARHWGRIINLSSVAAHIGGIIGPHYAASKAGILGLTHSYAKLFAAEGITVNAIAPALVESDMTSSNPNAKPSAVPVQRLGKADEVADVALMLARNGFMTGQTINVDGGIYMT